MDMSLSKLRERVKDGETWRCRPWHGKESDTTSHLNNNSRCPQETYHALEDKKIWFQVREDSFRKVTLRSWKSLEEENSRLALESREVFIQNMAVSRRPEVMWGTSSSD